MKYSIYYKPDNTKIYVHLKNVEYIYLPSFNSSSMSWNTLKPRKGYPLIPTRYLLYLIINKIYKECSFTFHIEARDNDE